MVIREHVMSNCEYMDGSIFFELCASLKQNGYLKDIREIKVEKAVVIFLIIISQNIRMRLVTD